MVYHNCIVGIFNSNKTIINNNYNIIVVVFNKILFLKAQLKKAIITKQNIIIKWRVSLVPVSLELLLLLITFLMNLESRIDLLKTVVSSPR